MENIEKIISTDPSGEINDINDLTFEALFAEKSDAIDQCDDSTERSRLMLELAKMCVECKHERKAISLYRDILRFGGAAAYQKDKESPRARFALQAYEDIQELANSSDEYVWEVAIQILSENRMYFQQQSR